MKNKNKLAKVYHYDLYGKRDEKYKFLDENSVNDIDWDELEYKEPYYFFVPKDFEAQERYDSYIKLNYLIKVSNSGVKTDRDKLFVDFDKETLANRMELLFSENFDSSFIKEFKVQDSSSYKLSKVIEINSFDYKWVSNVVYRPFDFRLLYYDPKVISRPGQDVFKHLIDKNNIGLITCRQQSTFDFQHIFISKFLSDICSVSSQTKETGYFFPLYLYPEEGEQQELGDATTPTHSVSHPRRDVASSSTGGPTTPPNFVRHPSTGGESGRKAN